MRGCPSEADVQALPVTVTEEADTADWLCGHCLTTNPAIFGCCRSCDEEKATRNNMGSDLASPAKAAAAVPHSSATDIASTSNLLSGEHHVLQHLVGGLQTLGARSQDASTCFDYHSIFPSGHSQCHEDSIVEYASSTERALHMTGGMQASSSVTHPMSIPRTILDASSDTEIQRGEGNTPENTQSPLSPSLCWDIPSPVLGGTCLLKIWAQSQNSCGPRSDSHGA